MTVLNQLWKHFKTAEKAEGAGDNLKALEYYQKAAEGGVVPAMAACGNLYFKGGGGIEKNAEKAIQWFKKAADFGNTAAMNNIGYIYGTLENYEEALTWYEKSAALDNVTAMLNLSSVYKNQFQNKKIAAQWLKKAESLKDTDSIREVAGFYAADAENDRQINKAIKLYQKAIALGDVDAQRELGDFYFHLEEFEDAQNCYREAAKSGNIEAMINLGMMLSYMPNCSPEAHYWLNKAANSGNAEALRVLGAFYEEREDYHNALRTYRKAFHAGENVQEEIRQMKNKIKRGKFNYKLRALNVYE